ncbi:MAG: M48 family metalloprotease [Gammaproteobacteria bacterium]
MRVLAFSLALLLGLLPGIAAAKAETAPTPASASVAPPGISNLNLPKLGLAGGGALPIWKAQFIGRFIFRQVEGDGGVLNDPLVENYVDHLGHRLSSVADGPNEPFHYFIVKTPAINAVTLPGAYIAVFSGLFLATRHEDELAGVMAHETAHAAQRHIAREMDASRYNDLLSLAEIIGGALIGIGVGGGAGAIIGLRAGQSASILHQLAFSRSFEEEADRVGIDILAKAGFNPNGMVEFFQYLEQNYAFNGYDVPEFLSSHPLDLERIADAEMRAKNLHVHPTPESPSYALMRARLRVLASNNLAQTLSYFKTRAKTLSKPWYRKAAIYGQVLCLNRLDSAKQALALIEPLANSRPDIVALQLAEAESLLAAGKTRAGLAALAQDNTLYASSPAVTLAYARALSNNNQSRKVVALLAPGMSDESYQFNPDFYRLLGAAANETGDDALAYLAMAHYYQGRGQYHPAVIQLRLGLKLANLSPQRRQQMEDMKKQLKADHKQAKKLGLVQRDQAQPSWQYTPQ